MKLFTYKFRELEHLPVTERDAVLVPCFRDPALLRFRHGSVLVMAPLVPACGLGFLYLALFRWQWGLLSAIGCGLLVLFGFIFLYLSGRVAVELWLGGAEIDLQLVVAGNRPRRHSERSLERLGRCFFALGRWGRGHAQGPWIGRPCRFA